MGGEGDNMKKSVAKMTSSISSAWNRGNLHDATEREWIDGQVSE